MHFCQEKGIVHEQSSPYHPESNGHTEAAVKNVKYLMLKVASSEFTSALAQWRNTARADRPSPNDPFLRRCLRLSLPMTKAYLEAWKDESAQGKMHELELHWNHEWENEAAAPADSREPRLLAVNTPVWVQDPLLKRWTIKATVQSITDTGRKYSLLTESNTVITRNCKFIQRRYV